MARNNSRPTAPFGQQSQLQHLRLSNNKQQAFNIKILSHFHMFAIHVSKNVA